MGRRLASLFIAILIVAPLTPGSAHGAGLVGWWKLDEAPGSVARDSSGGGRDGTITGSPTRIAGAIGGAWEFHGKGVSGGGGDQINCSSDAVMSASGPLSIALWMKPGAVDPEAKATETAPLAKALNPSWSWQLRYGWNSSKPFMGFQFNATGGSTWVYVNQNLALGEWCHVAGVYDGSTLKCYLNGTETDSKAMSGFTGGSWPLVIGSDGWGCDWIGGIDDVRIYDGPLTAEEIRNAMKGKPGVASDPNPSGGATDVPRDAALVWKAGEFAKTHDVYLGTVAADVNDATRSDAKGVLASQGQDAISYHPAGLLAFGQTYYWRVDEVNAPDKPATYKGDLWSFTSEPYGYPVKPVKATASSSMTTAMGPEKTIDGSGLDALDQHSTSAMQMWLSKKGQSPVWIQYEFDAVYKLYQMWVWNSNQEVEPAVGFGAMDVVIETSLDGANWTSLADVPEFSQASGEPNYVHNTTVEFGGVQAKFVRLTIKTNWADGTKQAGLSEVRFFYVPLKAFGAAPTNGATDVALDGLLNWRPGREAARHEVYLSRDASAVSKGTALVKTLTEHSLALGSLGLQYGQTYTWKVNEVNEAAATKSWEGDLWTFTTMAYAVVDDFESYDDLCNRLFFAWVDGFGYSASPDCGVAASGGNGTGSTVGNTNPPFAEKTIIHSGRQSMPVAFDNTKSPFYSETRRDWTAPQSWTAGGVDTLTVWVRGDAASFVETSPGTLIMNGTGTDIWDASDQFRLAYKVLKGNGSIVAKVESVSNTQEWAKAGVMIRESAAPGSKHAFVAVTPTATHGIAYQRRVDTDVATNLSTDVANTPVPQWVKLTRNGNAFTAQYSSDGTAWTDIAVSPAV
jgi:hypothetical protein